jgi:hypothetical protein
MTQQSRQPALSSRPLHRPLHGSHTSPYCWLLPSLPHITPCADMSPTHVAALSCSPPSVRQQQVDEVFALLSALIDAAERLRQFSPVKEQLSAAVLEEVRFRLYRIVSVTLSRVTLATFCLSLKSIQRSTPVTWQIHFVCGLCPHKPPTCCAVLCHAVLGPCWLVCTSRIPPPRQVNGAT